MNALCSLKCFSSFCVIPATFCGKTFARAKMSVHYRKEKWNNFDGDPSCVKMQHDFSFKYLFSVFILTQACCWINWKFKSSLLRQTAKVNWPTCNWDDLRQSNHFISIHVTKGKHPQTLSIFLLKSWQKRHDWVLDFKADDISPSPSVTKVNSIEG